MRLTSTSLIRLGRDHALEPIDRNEGIVLDMQRKLFRGLNETGLFILQRLHAARDRGAPCTVGSIIEALLDEFEAERAVVEPDVMTFLDDCRDRDIIEVVQQEQSAP